MYNIKALNISETLIDFIKECYEKQGANSKEEKIKVDVLLNDFYGMLQGLGREDLEYTPESELQLIELYNKLKEKEMQNGQLESANTKLKSENKQLKSENTQLESANTQLESKIEELKRQINNIRDFLTRKVAKIPFLGNKVLNEFNEELGKSLPEGSEK